MESRRTIAEKRKPRFEGCDDPAHRYRMPALGILAGDE